MRQFLITGYGLLSGNQEPETLQWFALQYNTPEPNYAILDTYEAESGRQAHITGEVAKALFADTLLSVVPDLPVTNYNLLASKIKPTPSGVEGDLKKGLTVGLRVLVKAKPGQIAAVREFLQVCANALKCPMGNLPAMIRARSLLSKRSPRPRCGTPSSSPARTCSGSESSTSSPRREVWTPT